MPQKLKPIDEVIANPSPPAREKSGPGERNRIEPRPPSQLPPKEKR
jgi:hypothetical protein